MSTETESIQQPNLLKRVWSKPYGRISITLLLLIALSAFFADWVAPFDPNELDTENIFSRPSGMHYFGTDDLGRDLFSRVLHGGQIALIMAFASAAIAMIVGVIWGFIAAQFGGWLDEILMRTVDAFLAIPIILLALILIAALGTDIPILALVIGLILAPATARIARSSVLSELQLDYCSAAITIGTPRLRILFREVMPNTMPVLIARAVICAADAIIIEASLSFVGLGINPPQASWGSLVRTGYEQLLNGYWLVLFPAIFILLAIWCLNSLGDQILDVLDPRSES